MRSSLPPIPATNSRTPVSDATASACKLAYWHVVRFSSGSHGSDTVAAPLFKAAYQGKVDVVVNGHDHDYERFAKQTDTGAL